MNANVRLEEVTAVGDFLLTSYNRDFDAIKSKFATMNAAFRDGFVAKLDFVKKLESTLMLKHNLDEVTDSLYAEAKELNDVLNFVSIYFTDASLDAGIVSALKKDLFKNNIEGAILKLENLKQFVVTHEAALTLQGMEAGFPATLTGYKADLSQKNRLQNDYINARKQLTDANLAHYQELLKMIKKINRNGKVVFKGKVTKDEYTMTKIIKRMRAAKHKKDGPVKE